MKCDMLLLSLQSEILRKWREPAFSRFSPIRKGSAFVYNFISQ